MNPAWDQGIWSARSRQVWPKLIEFWLDYSWPYFIIFPLKANISRPWLGSFLNGSWAKPLKFSSFYWKFKTINHSILCFINTSKVINSQVQQNYQVKMKTIFLQFPTPSYQRIIIFNSYLNIYWSCAQDSFAWKCSPMPFLDSNDKCLHDTAINTKPIILIHSTDDAQCLHNTFNA